MVKFPTKKYWIAGCLFAAVLWSGLAQAGLIIQGSRVIYPAKEREISVKVNNEGLEPALMQAWVDKGNSHLTPAEADGPFLITPPITRVEANKGQTLRLVYTGDDAATKKQETVFWLNVLDVPPMPKAQDTNFLQVAVRSRLKIFYRPEGLPGNPTEAAVNLRWSIVKSDQGFVVRSTNDSAFHVALSSIRLEAGGKSYKVNSKDVKMVAPGTSQDFVLPHMSAAPSTTMKLTYEWVSDYGAVIPQEANL